MSLISRKKEKIFAKGVIGNVRKAQEDSYGWKLGTPNGDLFVVCDGMGGHVGGAMASKIAVDNIIEHINKEQYPTPIEALDGALQFANMQILGYADTNPEFKGMGTTACIVLIQDDGVWVAHVGDSRIYLYLGKERQLHRITKDHSYVQTLVDQGRITDEQAESHPNKNRIMKALGIKPDLHPTFNFENKPIHPKNGDVFLICSDGLSGMIPDRSIERVLGQNMSLTQKGDRLIELAMIGETVQPGGQDNCTLELIEIDNSKFKSSVFKSYNPSGTMVGKGGSNHSGGWLIKTMVVMVALILALGVATWVLNPYRYDRLMKEAEKDTIITYQTLTNANQKYQELTQKRESLNDIKNSMKTITEYEEAERAAKEYAAFYDSSDVTPAKEAHLKAVENYNDLKKKKENRSNLWNKIFYTNTKNNKSRN